MFLFALDFWKMMGKVGSYKLSISLLAVAFALYAVQRERRAKGACRTINEICRSHGFQLGHNQDSRERFYRECFMPLMNTARTQNISIDEEIAVKCRESYGQRDE